MDKTKELTKKFYKDLIKLAVPFALQGFLIALVGASDALMLGKLTQEYMSAISLANQVAFVMSLFFSATIGAIGVLVAQYYGKGDNLTVKRLLSMSLRDSFVIGFIFFIITFIMPDKLMLLFTDDPTLISIGASYLKIVSFSYIFSSLSQPFLMMMKLDGRAKECVIISLVTVICDMGIDYIFIYGNFGAPALGSDATAYSTVFVEIFALVFCLISSFRKERIHPDLKSMVYFNETIVKDFIKIATPLLAGGLLWGLSISVHSSVMGHQGDDMIAAYSVSNVVMQLIQCICQGLATGIGIIIGEALGKNELEKAKLYGRKSWDVAIFSGILNIILIALVGPIAYFFFELTPLAKTYLIQMLIYTALYLFAFSFNTVFTCGVFPAGGDSIYDAISLTIATWIVSIPLTYICWKVFNLHPMIIYMIMCADEIVKFPFLIPRYKTYIWLKNLTKEIN